jgi:ABC-type antimicrobial peptide transport system permease subunit
MAPDRYGSFYMLTNRPASAVKASLRKSLAQTDPIAVVRGASALESGNRQLVGTRFLTWMLSGFAIFSAFLAIVGMHGVIAYVVLQRRREFAIRIALGATRQAVTVLSMRGGVVVLALGLGFGVFTAAGMGRVLQSRLYGVAPFDLGTLLGASVAMALAGALAIWWPARRAAAVDPVAVLNEN